MGFLLISPIFLKLWMKFVETGSKPFMGLHRICETARKTVKIDNIVAQEEK